MAVKTVTLSVNNAAPDSTNLIWTLLVIVNELSTALNALTAKLDEDAGITDTNYAATIGAMDTITTIEKGDPA